MCCGVLARKHNFAFPGSKKENMEEGQHHHNLLNGSREQYIPRVVTDISRDAPSHLLFLNRWKEVAPQLIWQIFLGDPRQRKDSQEVHLPAEEVHIFDEAASISLILHRQCTLRLPFDIGRVHYYNDLNPQHAHNQHTPHNTQHHTTQHTIHTTTHNT